MNKPNNYDNTRTGNSFVPINLGGHFAVIKQVEEMKSRSGKDMIAVYIDFADGDEQAHYFADQYKNDTRAEKKWPYQAIHYITTEDAEGNTRRDFKAFCTAFEDSNGTTIKWGGSNWGAQFKNKKIGVVFRDVEEEYNGDIRTRRRIAWFCNYEEADSQPIPAKKPYNGPRTAPATNSNDWMQIPDGVEDELPFR